MTTEQIVIYAIDKFSQPGASSSGFVSGFFLIASAAVWIKRYLINGNLKKYFDLKEREISALFASRSCLESVDKKLDIVIQEQKNFLREL